VKLGLMPAERALLMLNKEHEPLDSVLVARGCKPHEMEDKWFIVFEKGRLHFQGSWTGICLEP